MEKEQLDIEELKKGYHANRDEINEIKIVLMGPAPGRSNGLRGELRHIKDKLNNFINEVEAMWDGRKKDCFGLEACKKLEERVEMIEAKNAEIAVAKTNLKGVYFVAVMTFLGQIATVLMVLLKKGA